MSSVISLLLKASKIGAASEASAGALDEATCHAETLCDSIEIAGRADEVLKGAAFLGGGHLELMEVGRRGRFGQFGIVAGKDHDGDIEIGFRDRTALGEQAKRAPTASAIEDLEGAARLLAGVTSRF
jgi:poly(3-hydroxybutyrate) depolymerase